MAINYMDIKEFREMGLLQEANRQFFHPLGLALEVIVEDDGSEHLGGVWDYRDDPEGMIFGGPLSQEKVDKVETLREEHRQARRDMFGMQVTVQPVGWDPSTTEITPK